MKNIYAIVYFLKFRCWRGRSISRSILRLGNPAKTLMGHLNKNILLELIDFIFLFKQFLSVSDIQKLKIGDQLCDGPQLSLAKLYTIGNISHGLVYAIHQNGHFELKIFRSSEMPATSWWLLTQPDQITEHLRPVSTSMQ